MLDSHRIILATATAALLTTLAPADAEACSCLFACQNIVDTGQKLGSGAEGFYWFLAGQGVPAADIPDGVLTIEKLVNGTYEVVEEEIAGSNDQGTYHIVRPVEGFEIGATYRFTADLTGWEEGSNCGVELEQGLIDAVVTLETEIVAVTPGVALTAEVGDLMQEKIAFESDGMCSEQLDAAYRDVTFELPRELEGLEDSLFFRVSVDGNDYVHASDSCWFIDILPGSLDQGRTTTRLATVCGEYPDYAAATALEPGTHELVVSASFPGSEVFKWTSAPIPFELDCPPEEEPDMGSGEEPDMAPDMAPEPEPDMGSGGEEMGQGPETPDMGSGDSDGDDEDEPRCAQVAPAAPSSTPWGVALGLLGMLGLVRRRR